MHGQAAYGIVAVDRQNGVLPVSKFRAILCAGLVPAMRKAGPEVLEVPNPNVCRNITSRAAFMVRKLLQQMRN